MPPPEGREMTSRGSILIRGATIVADDGTRVGDCRIVDGIIETMVFSSGLAALPGEEVIDASGLHLIHPFGHPKSTFATRERWKKRTWKAAHLPPPAAE